MSDDAPAPVPELMERANETLNVHWRRPDAPWEPKCRHCRDGHCPRLEWAEGYVMGLMRSYLLRGQGE